MARKKSKEADAESEIPSDVLDALIANYSKPSDLIGPNGLLKKLTAALVNRAMEAELTEHVGYEPGESPPAGQSNRRNGTSDKRLRTDQGEIAVKVPRDREGSFEPQLVPKHQRHFDGFDDQILALYARGASVRDIRAHLQELYGVEVSPDLISRVTDSVIDELKAWQQRALEPTYLIVYLDALVLKTRDKGAVQNKHVYLAVGVGTDGKKDVLGMWIQTTEGAKFWLAILGELRSRGVEDILVMCADGLTGLPDAVEATYPQAIFQTCIVHVVRNSTRFVPWKQRKALCADLRRVYSASDEQADLGELDAFEAKWGTQFPMIGEMWRHRAAGRRSYCNWRARALASRLQHGLQQRPNVHRDKVRDGAALTATVASPFGDTRTVPKSRQLHLVVRPRGSGDVVRAAGRRHIWDRGRRWTVP